MFQPPDLYPMNQRQEFGIGLYRAGYQSMLNLLIAYRTAREVISRVISFRPFSLSLV